MRAPYLYIYHPECIYFYESDPIDSFEASPCIISVPASALVQLANLVDFMMNSNICIAFPVMTLNVYPACRITLVEEDDDIDSMYDYLSDERNLLWSDVHCEEDDMVSMIRLAAGVPVLANSYTIAPAHIEIRIANRKLIWQITAREYQRDGWVTYQHSDFTYKYLQDWLPFAKDLLEGYHRSDG